MPTTSLMRAKPGAPCAVCGGNHKCSRGADGLILCGRPPEQLRTGQKYEGFVYLGRSKKDEQWGEFRHADDPVLQARERERQEEWERSRTHNRPKPSANGDVHHGENGAHDGPDFEALARRYAAGLTPERAADLAQVLGLRPDVLARLPLLGYSATDPYGPCWTFPECDGADRIIGLTRRYENGKKVAIEGSRRGLVLPAQWDQADGPIFAVEGPSDVLALLALNLAAVGRPSNLGGAQYLAELLRDVPAEREIIVVAEYDANDKGQWPGLDGAKKTAARLAEALGRPVSWSLPPKGAKDVRAWTVAQQLPGDCLDAWHEAGQALRAVLMEKAQQAKFEPEAATGFQWQPLDSAAFAAADYRPRWLVKRVLVAGQAAVVGGAKKMLKTSLEIDMAVSLASATPFLGAYEVPQPVRVAVLSDESGPFTLQETARRVCRARGLELADLGDRLVWQFTLPQLAKADHLDALERGLREGRVEVVVVDPLYLSLLAGQGPGGARAESIYDMGPLLLAVTQACLRAGATPVFVHHCRKGASASHEPIDLDDLAFSGVAEFARQWILISRREKYVSGSGLHKLWLNVGGSTGHGGLWGVDVAEGNLADDFSGRTWDVTVQTFAEERQSAEEALKEAKQRRNLQQDNEDDAALTAALDKLDPEARGHSWNQLQAEARLSDTRMQRAVNRLKAQVVEEVPVVVEVGSGARRTAKGLKRRADG